MKFLSIYQFSKNATFIGTEEVIFETDFALQNKKNALQIVRELSFL